MSEDASKIAVIIAGLDIDLLMRKADAKNKRTSGIHDRPANAGMAAGSATAEPKSSDGRPSTPRRKGNPPSNYRATNCIRVDIATGNSQPAIHTSVVLERLAHDRSMNYLGESHFCFSK
jgi:hypothetical protein